MGCIGSSSTPTESREVPQYDPDFEGPSRNRSCTDIFWLILFIIFLGVWGFVGIYSLKYGDIGKLLAPIDSNGKRCGLDAGLQSKRYLVFFNIENCLSPAAPIMGCRTPQVCVEECPKETIDFRQMSEIDFNAHKYDMVCTEDVNIYSMTLSDAKRYINDNKCANIVLQSQSVLSHCIGDLSSLQCNKSMNLSTQNSNCVENPDEGRKVLVNKALDSYVRHFIASCVIFFTYENNERYAQIFISYLLVGAVMGRCLVNTTAAEAGQYLRNITERLGMDEKRALEKFSEVAQFNQLSGKIVHDLVESRWFVLGSLVAVIVLCFIYILLLRWVVFPVVWVSLFGLLVLLGFSLYLCFNNYVYYRNYATLDQTTNLKGYVESIFHESVTWLVLIVIVSVILLVLLLIVIFLRSRINIAIELIREGSKAVTAIKSTVIFPLIPWIIQCFVIAYGAAVLIHLWSIGESVFKVVVNNATDCNCNNGYQPGVTCKPAEFLQVLNQCYDVVSGRECKAATCHFTGLESPSSVVLLHLINLLCFFWTMFFISGISEMILASTFSTWYWTQYKRDLPFFTLTAGIYRTLRYHQGTVALGALIIAIVRVIRVILEYIDRKLKKFENPFTKCIMCVCKCCCWCLENCLKFINKNAYIMCAVHGHSFCRSARDAFSLLMRNIARTVVLDKVADFIFFLSKLLISIGVGFAVYYLLESNILQEQTNIQQLYYNHIPAIVLGCATYLICTIFFKVYEMAVDTLFICFLEDSERNDGSPERPYLMSRNLMRILGKKNKI